MKGLVKKMLKIKDMFNADHKWISLSTIPLIGDWSDLTNTTAVDNRLYDFYGEKVLSADMQKLSKGEITAAVANFINSQVYKLDTLFETTELDYNPLENYNMTESGRDETRNTSSGSTTTYTTSYNSSTEAESGKNEAGGSSSSALIHSFSRSGNVGVTTSQQMLQAQREVAELDFIGIVAEMIVHNFTTSLYYPATSEMELIF